MELMPALLLCIYVIIVLVHTVLQERFRKPHWPVPIEDQDDRLPAIRDQRPTVDVIIPTFNEDPEVLDACLGSLARQDYQGEMHFLVVDDGSANRDDLLPVYERYRQLPHWTVIYHADNMGKRKAQETAIYGSRPTGETVLGHEHEWKGSRAQFLLMVDSDTVVRPDGISWILAPFQDEKVAAVTGDVGILNEDFNRLTKLIGERYRLLFGHERAAQSHFGKVFCCAGPFSAYRR
jgi:N-acetylglucosaminyltransferase